MVEEPRGDDHATLLVNEKIAPLANPLVDAIDPELELRLATPGNGSGTHTPVRGADAILVSLTFGIELGEHRPVIELHSAEVSVRDRDQPLAWAPLLRRQDFGECGIVNDLVRIAEGRRHGRLAVDDRLHLDDPTVHNFQPHGVIRRRTVLLNGTEPGRTSGRGVCHLQPVRCRRGDRAPQTVIADRHLDVVFGKPDIRRQVSPPGILVGQGVHVAVHETYQTLAIAAFIANGAALPGCLGRRGAHESGERGRQGRCTHNPEPRLLWRRIV